MAIFRCSMFGHIVYDDKLTYQELLDTEAHVSAVMLRALEECGAQHIDFTPQADSLLMECVFPDLDRDHNRALCDMVIRQLGPGVLARFLFVDRQMDSAVFYFLGRGKWQEQALSVPGPREALSGWVVRQERKPAQPRRKEDAAPTQANAPDEPAAPGEAVECAETAAPSIPVVPDQAPNAGDTAAQPHIPAKPKKRAPRKRGG